MVTVRASKDQHSACFLYSRLLHDIANQELDELAADIANQSVNLVTFKARKKDIKATIKRVLGVLPILEEMARAATRDELRDYSLLKNDLDSIQYKFLGIKM